MLAVPKGGGGGKLYIIFFIYPAGKLCLSAANINRNHSRGVNMSAIQIICIAFTLLFFFLETHI